MLASSEDAIELGDAVDLVRAEDEVTLRRMRDGLSACAKAEGRTLRLLEAILGAQPPRPVRARILSA